MSTPTLAAPKKVPTTPKITAGRLKGAEYARRLHRATPEAGTQLKDVLDPAYWSHVAANLTVNDVIEVIPEGGAWFAQLWVIGCSKLHAKVKVLSMTKLNDDDVKTSDKPVASKGSDAKDKGPKVEAFSVEFKGPQHKWSVIRTADKEYAKDGFDSKDDAAKWLDENEAALLA